MFFRVEKLEYLEGYKIRLTFSDRIIQEIDLTEEFYGEIFEPLKDIELFKQVFLNPETKTIEWSNGADFAPEFLYNLGQPVSQTA